MSEYHKINTIYKRDPASKAILDGEWSLPEFEFLAGNQWVFTEQGVGTNIRIVINGGRVSFAGRTDDAQLPPRLLARLGERFGATSDRLCEVFPDGAVMYGEGYGAKIQKVGHNYRADQDFVLFDVRVGSWWLQRSDVEDVAHKLGVDVVPVIGRGTLHDAINLARTGIMSTWGDFEAEGIVARPSVELMTRAGNRVIAKIKCRDFRR